MNMNRDDDVLARYLETGLHHDLPDHLRREEIRLEEALSSLPVPRKLPTSIRAAVLARVRAATSSPLMRAWTWLTYTREIRVSPLGAMGGLALAAVAAFLIFLVPFTTKQAPLERLADTGVRTKFVLLEPKATQVAVTGDFAHWAAEGVPLERDADGLWMAEISLPPGIHNYVFVVDGKRWIPDPRAMWSVDDGFGSRNSVIVIPKSQT
jgi:hypothetical protein